MTNFNLFDRYLGKITQSTIKKFGSSENLFGFLEEITKSSSIITALNKVKSITISPLEIHRVIRADKALTKCINIALALANELAEGTLFDRAINGYTELTYDKDGKCTAVMQKHRTGYLLGYLKSNLEKYRNNNSGKTKENKAADKDNRKPVKVAMKRGMPLYEITSIAKPNDCEEPVRPV